MLTQYWCGDLDVVTSDLVWDKCPCVQWDWDRKVGNRFQCAGETTVVLQWAKWTVTFPAAHFCLVCFAFLSNVENHVTLLLASCGTFEVAENMADEHGRKWDRCLADSAVKLGKFLVFCVAVQWYMNSAWGLGRIYIWSVVLCLKHSQNGSPVKAWRPFTGEVK